MKPLAERIHTSPRVARLFHWGKLISVTGSAQAMVQGFGFVCGLLVIRLLPVKEYAWYTLANTMLGTMSVLADGGISTGVMAQGGKIWQDKEKLGTVLATGLALRKKFAVVSLLIALPVLVYLLSDHEAGWLTIILTILSLIPAVFATLSDSILEIIPKLHQEIITLQKNQLAVSFGRLVLSGMMLFIFPFTFIAILAAGLPRVIGNIKLKKIAGEFADSSQKPDPEIQRKILVLVKRILPGSIYYCLSGQITVWLISIFGSTSAIAQVGALGRLAMLLNVLIILLSTLVTPRFARLPNHDGLLLRRFLQVHIGLLFVGILILSVVYIFSNQALWLLGPSYANLKTELLLSFTGSYLGFMAGSLFSLNTSRGWAVHPLIFIPLNLLVIVISAMLLNISTLRGIFKFNIFVMSSEVVIYFSYGLFSIFTSNDK